MRTRRVGPTVLLLLLRARGAPPRKTWLLSGHRSERHGVRAAGAIGRARGLDRERSVRTGVSGQRPRRARPDQTPAGAPRGPVPHLPARAAAVYYY